MLTEGNGFAESAPVTGASLESSPADDARRERLLASLRDCDVQRAPRAPQLQWLITMIVVGAIIVFAMVGRYALAVNMRQSRVSEGVVWAIDLLWIAFVIFVLARIRNRFLRLAWQTSARSAEEELERAGSRRPVFYLRSFGLDDRLAEITWRERLLGLKPLATPEQGLTNVMRKHVGPVIAIGRPDEKLPALGAARFYVSHERWQEKVQDVAKESQFVVWATGVTEGLRWEISHLIENLPPEKLVLWAHPHLLRLSEPEREAEWTRFRTQLGGVFPKPLPERLGEARLIYFEPDWTPRGVAPPRHDFAWSMRSLLGAQRSALLALLAARGRAEIGKLAGRWRRLGPVGVAILVGAVLGVLATIFLPAYTQVEQINGVVKNEHTSYKGEYGGLRALVNFLLFAATLSLLFGRSPILRRIQTSAVLLLALFAAVLAVLWVAEERTYTFRDTKQEYRGGLMSGEPPVTAVYAREPAAGSYLNLVLAAVVVGASGVLARDAWRPAAVAADGTRPLRVEELVYHGEDEEREFARIIGAAGIDIDWRRIAGFALALLAMTPPGFHSGGLHATTLVRAVV
jgi:hypothetical protein